MCLLSSRGIKVPACPAKRITVASEVREERGQILEGLVGTFTLVAVPRIDEKAKIKAESQLGNDRGN